MTRRARERDGLPHGANLRDLGGLPTMDGRRVRQGMVFRSASPSGLPAAALETLRGHGVRLVVDMRSTAERSRAGSAALAETWFHDYDGSDADLLRLLRDRETCAERMRGAMVRTYRRLPDEQAPAIAHIMRALARGDVPLLIHCAAGKDRTGAAVAVLLTLLGVPRAAVMRDYLRTMEAFDHLLADVRAALRAYGVDPADDGVLRAVAAADADYLDALFDAIETGHGTVEAYAFRRLGLTEADLAAVRRRLLEPA